MVFVAFEAFLPLFSAGPRPDPDSSITGPELQARFTQRRSTNTGPWFVLFHSSVPRWRRRGCAAAAPRRPRKTHVSSARQCIRRAEVELLQRVGSRPLSSRSPCAEAQSLDWNFSPCAESTRPHDANDTGDGPPGIALGFRCIEAPAPAPLQGKRKAEALVPERVSPAHPPRPSTMAGHANLASAISAVNAVPRNLASDQRAGGRT